MCQPLRHRKTRFQDMLVPCPQHRQIEILLKLGDIWGRVDDFPDPFNLDPRHNASESGIAAVILCGGQKAMVVDALSVQHNARSGDLEHSVVQFASIFKHFPHDAFISLGV